MALGSCSTAASCSRLVDENGPAPSRQEVEGGHRLGSFSYHTGSSEPRTTLPAAQPTTSVDPVGVVFCAVDLTGCATADHADAPRCGEAELVAIETAETARELWGGKRAVLGCHLSGPLFTSPDRAAITRPPTTHLYYARLRGDNP